MTFVLGSRSLTNLQGVHPTLIEIVKDAILISPVDFGVPAKAVRTLAEQRNLLAQGVTKTLHSKHLVHDDGYGWAVDLIPFIGGKFVWEPLEPFHQIAQAMRTAAGATETTWGAIWDRTLQELPADLHAAVAAYNQRHPGPDFNDYPHHQLGRN